MAHILVEPFQERLRARVVADLVQDLRRDSRRQIRAQPAKFVVKLFTGNAHLYRLRASSSLYGRPSWRTHSFLRIFQ